MLDLRHTGRNGRFAPLSALADPDHMRRQVVETPPASVTSRPHRDPRQPTTGDPGIGCQP
jgi:hypothetical protein